ncbi:hypothetical protein JCM33374_g2676 [Metschnikowia sp. JCM 33374]|nr:hypothetical protein JCM33374_g2676 [Metschnikowia sp. JCM 33374]
MPYSCTSPTSVSEEDWINEVLSFPPLDLNTSNDVQSSLASPVFGPDSGSDITPDYEDIFSSLSNNTSATTPESAAEPAPHSAKDVSTSNHHLLDNVSLKLHQLKQQNRLTPKALESVFNTQDVLAAPTDWQADAAKHKPRRSKANAYASACTCTTHEHAPGVKSTCHLRQKAAAMHLQGPKKRKNSRAKVPKPAHPHGQQFHQTSPLATRKGSSANVSEFHSPLLEPATDASRCYSTYEPYLFPESWYSSSHLPEPIAESPARENPGFDPLSSSGTSFDQPLQSNFSLGGGSVPAFHSSTNVPDPSISPIPEIAPIENPCTYASAGPMRSVSVGSQEYFLSEKPVPVSAQPTPTSEPAPSKGTFYDTSFPETNDFFNFLQVENLLQ